MLSLGNAFEEDEVRDFVRRIAQKLDRDKPVFSAEPKLDGGHGPSAAASW